MHAFTAYLKSSYNWWVPLRRIFDHLLQATHTQICLLHIYQYSRYSLEATLCMDMIWFYTSDLIAFKMFYMQTRNYMEMFCLFVHSFNEQNNKLLIKREIDKTMLNWNSKIVNMLHMLSNPTLSLYLSPILFCRKTIHC